MTDLVFDHECSRCGGEAHDVMDEPREGMVTLWCVYCGLREDVPKRTTKPSSRIESTHGEEFRFQFGRFKGMTLAEADSQPHGRPYLEWMAKNNDKLKQRIGEYLAQSA